MRLQCHHLPLGRILGTPPPQSLQRVVFTGDAVAAGVVTLTEILFESQDRSVVLGCGPDFCLKLIRDGAVYRTEREAYGRLVQRQAAGLFMQILFFCEVPCVLPAGAIIWRGYYMRRGSYSLRDILFRPTNRMTEEQHAGLLRRLEADRALPLAAEGGGVVVQFKPDQPAQLSLCVAALRLLQALHRTGCVHGDSHLGNFVYRQGRVYAIDFERSLATEDPVQHLLDIQETFGHMSGIMLQIGGGPEWDLKDLTGIYFHRHPLFDSTRPNACRPLPSPLQRRLGIPACRRALYMLPACTCFTCPTEALRLKGCALCKSASNQHSAARFAAEGDAIIADVEAWGLDAMRASLMQSRKESIRKCGFVADIIFPCLQDGLVLCQPEELPAKELQKSKASCALILKKILYMPALSSYSMVLTKRLCVKLHRAGHREAARVLWLYVAPTSSVV
jgi:hypothetical protein